MNVKKEEIEDNSIKLEPETTIKEELNDMKPFGCDSCHSAFFSVVDLDKHKEVHHKSRQYFTCKFCNKIFSRNIDLFKHEKVHTNPLFSCEICQQDFAYERDLSRHKKGHEEHDFYPCEFCGKLFVNKSHLKGHLVKHTKDKDYKCDICDKYYYSKDSLVKHQKVCRRSSKECFCKTCDKQFTSSVYFARHLLSQSHKKLESIDIPENDEEKESYKSVELKKSCKNTVIKSEFFSAKDNEKNSPTLSAVESRPKRIKKEM